MDFTPLKNLLDNLTNWKIPGNTISVCIDNKEVFAYQSGYADYENKIKMTSDTLLNVYSCSKVITVTALMQLYEKGFFTLDTPLYDFIPEFKEMFVKRDDGEIEKAKNIITMRHLFTMTSGLTYNVSAPGIIKAKEITDGKMNTLTVAKCIASDPLAFEPGTRWYYGLSHDILGAVAQVITGKKFSDYVTENIFLPLGMNNSYYHNDGVQERMAQQYHFYPNFTDTDKENFKNGFKNSYTDNLRRVGNAVGFVFGSEYDSGGAGVTTSTDDYSKFASALANDGIGATKEQILKPNTINLLSTDQLNETLHKDFDNDNTAGYGYGLGVQTVTDLSLFKNLGSLHEFGWGGAAGSNDFINPEMRLSCFYGQHTLNPPSYLYHRLVRNTVYECLK